jgi:hypothetical protein
VSLRRGMCISMGIAYFLHHVSITIAGAVESPPRRAK